MDDTRAATVGLVGSSAGGVEEVRARLVEPLLERGYRVVVTLTPTAATWLSSIGETDAIEAVTGYPVRHTPRLPSEESPHPDVDCYVVAPASANTVAKLALGIADNQAVTQVCEAIGERRQPVIVLPRVNAAHADHPAWDGHIATLRDVGVHLATARRSGRCTNRARLPSGNCRGRRCSTRSRPRYEPEGRWRLPLRE